MKPPKFFKIGLLKEEDVKMKTKKIGHTENICIMVFRIIWVLDVHDLGPKLNRCRRACCLLLSPVFILKKNRWACVLKTMFGSRKRQC